MRLHSESVGVSTVHSRTSEHHARRQSYTPAEAAEFQGVSRPYVVRLLDDGKMPSERLPGSTHRRIRLADVLAYRANRDSQPRR